MVRANQPYRKLLRMSLARFRLNNFLQGSPVLLAETGRMLQQIFMHHAQQMLQRFRLARGEPRCRLSPDFSSRCQHAVPTRPAAAPS